MRDEARAVLVLESGRVFHGRAFGAAGAVLGEAVFNTSMTGYQEILEDPSYAGQIVVMTVPHIGNTGINDEDRESAQPACAGLVVRELASQVSSWRARASLSEYMAAHGVVGIQGVDTRAVTRALRREGAQRCAIATLSDDTSRDDDIARLVEQVRAHPEMSGRDLARDVTCGAHYSWPREPGHGRLWHPPDVERMPTMGEERSGREARLELGIPHVVAYDFGIKRNILRSLASAGCRVTVMPAQTPATEVLDLEPDGIFLSNGPGDPAAVNYAIRAVRTLLEWDRPIFGICLGFQILALALGARTYKLDFGHRGGNHPVREQASGRVAITAHNHGFAVALESLPPGVEATHISLYDGTLEGLEVRGRPVFGVQYHPEASPGPHDAQVLFARFLKSIHHASRVTG